MAALRKRAEDEGVRVQTVEQHGDPAEIIDLHASARAADLIVMGGEPRRSWRRGSLVAERVIRRTNVPTLVVAGDAAEVPTPFRSVLVAVDLSPASKEVLDGAIALTGGAAVQLTMMHAVDGEETSQARRMLREVASNVPANVDTRVRVSAGSAARAIHERAGTLNADLVVVGRSRGFKILGSTALRVLRKNDRALLVVPSGARRSQQLERDLAA
jgi:nucleotide-binding universal stress UspA family protein